MTVQAKYAMTLEVDETVELGLDHVVDPEVTHSLGSDAETLDGSTDPPVSKAWSGQVTLTAGAASLDLTALARGNLPAVDLTGLKIQALKLKCPTSNTTAILVVKGAVNPYNLFGPTWGTPDRVMVVPGACYQFVFNDELMDVASTFKAIDLTGTGTESIDVELVAG